MLCFYCSLLILFVFCFLLRPTWHIKPDNDDDYHLLWLSKLAASHINKAWSYDTFSTICSYCSPNI